MPQLVDIPGVGTAEFPDGMSPEEMASVIKRDVYAKPAIEQAVEQTGRVANMLDIGLRARSTPAFSPDSVAETVAPATNMAQVAATNEAGRRELLSEPNTFGASSITPEETEYRESAAERVAQEADATSLLTKLSTPLAQIVNGVDSQTIKRFLTVSAPTLSAQMARQRYAEGADKTYPEHIIGREGEKFAGIAAGATESGAGLINFFTSPIGIATLGIGALPSAAQKTIAAAFTIQMLANAPAAAKEIENELAKPEDERDYQVLARATGDFIQSGAFSALGGKGTVHGVGPKLGRLHGGGWGPVVSPDISPLVKAAETVKAANAPATAEALKQQAIAAAVQPTISPKVEPTGEVAVEPTVESVVGPVVESKPAVLGEKW